MDWHLHLRNNLVYFFLCNDGVGVEECGFSFAIILMIMNKKELQQRNKKVNREMPFSFNCLFFFSFEWRERVTSPIQNKNIILGDN